MCWEKSVVGRIVVLSSSTAKIELEANNWGQKGFYKWKTLESEVYSKKIINGMEHKITSWKFQFLVGETQPWKGHLGLYCNLAHFVKLSNIEIIYFGLPGEIPQELQEDKFWRLWNLNGIVSVPVYLCCSFILDFLNLVTKSHRKFRLLENQ